MDKYSMLQLPYQGLAPIYDYVMRHVDYDEWADFIRDVFARYAPEAKHLIDLACGTGNVSSELSLLGFSITGADLSESMVRIAQEKAALRGDDSTFMQRDLRALSLGGALENAEDADGIAEAIDLDCAQWPRFTAIDLRLHESPPAV